MYIFKKEFKMGFKPLCIWTGAIAFMLVICIFMYPELQKQMNEMTEVFANMGSFTKAFGMDRLNFGDLMGYYGVECGNVLGVGGGFFAAYLGIVSLSKEEKEHTAEFLLTHPVSRRRVISEKLANVLAQITLMNVVIVLLSMGSILAIGEELPMKVFLLVHISYYLLQLELGILCFGISAFIRGAAIGLGIGIAAIMYFLNIIGNITDSASWLKYITPFAYANSADIVETISLDGKLITIGLTYGIVITLLGYVKYMRKDIAS